MPVKLPDVLAKQWAMAVTHPDINVNQQSVPYKWRKQLFTIVYLESAGQDSGDKNARFHVFLDGSYNIRSRGSSSDLHLPHLHQGGTCVCGGVERFPEIMSHMCGYFAATVCSTETSSSFEQEEHNPSHR